MGFCILVAERLAPPLLPLVEAYLEQGLKGVLSGRAGVWKFERKVKWGVCNLAGAMVVGDK